MNLCISKEIIHEVLGVLAQKFSKGSEELSRTAVFLSELGELVVPREKLAVLDDEPDNRILECAVNGHADVRKTDGGRRSVPSASTRSMPLRCQTPATSSPTDSLLTQCRFHGGGDLGAKQLDRALHRFGLQHR